MPKAKPKEPEAQTVAAAEAVTETVQRFPLSELHPFEGHPLDGLRHGLSRCLRLFFLCSWHLCSPRFLNVGLWEKQKRRVPQPPSGAGYTPMYQSAGAKKERILTAGFLQRRYPLYEVLLCLIVGVLPSLRRPALLLSSVLGQKTEPTPQNPHFRGFLRLVLK